MNNTKRKLDVFYSIGMVIVLAVMLMSCNKVLIQPNTNNIDYSACECGVVYNVVSTTDPAYNVDNVKKRTWHYIYIDNCTGEEEYGTKDYKVYEGQNNCDL